MVLVNQNLYRQGNTSFLWVSNATSIHIGEWRYNSSLQCINDKLEVCPVS